MSVRDDLLARVDIVDVVGKYVQLRRTGKNRLGLCPFHKEKTPSFTVAEDKQIYKCFGCGKGGNAVNFVMEAERIDYRDAIKELARMSNFDLTPYERNPEITEKRQQDREKLKLLNKRLQEFFAAQFVGSEAEQYVLDRRKLTPATIQTFGIGYAPDSYTELISYAQSKGFSTEDLQQAGMITQGSNGSMPFFRKRVTFPIFDHIGNIVGFGGRALSPDQNPKYLNTTETPLYEKSQLLFGLDKARQYLKEYGFLIVVEGYMDVIALYQYGVPLGVATCGTALTADHIKLLKRHTDQVVFLFDNDQAGLDATKRAMKVAYQSDIYPRACLLPAGVKDVDEWLTAQGMHITPTAILEISTDAFAHLLERLSDGVDLKNPVYRKKFQQQLFEVIQSLEDYGIVMMYLEQLGTFLRMSSPEITKEFKVRLQQQKRGIGNQIVSKKPEHPDQLRLLIAFCTDEYWRSLVDHEVINSLVTVFSSLQSYGSSLLVLPVLAQEEILAMQLWRERQLDGMTTDKRVALVSNLLKKMLHDLVKLLMKDPHLTNQQKTDLTHLLRSE